MNLGEIVTTDLITKADATTPIPVASTGTIYTPSFPLTGVESVELLAASEGTVDVLIQLEVGAAKPATEEASDSNWGIPDGLADVANLVDENVHNRDINNSLGKFGRFKMIGQGSNHSTTTVRIKIHRREYP